MQSEAEQAALDDVDMLGPGPIERIRLDLTTRCNLRCVYCLVSQVDYAGRDMTPEIIAKAKKFILQLATYHKLAPVDVNGHGETTYFASWVETCRTLLRGGIALRLTSNFAKDFDDTELDVLARMKSIAISIDTSDRATLRRIRRKVDVRQIVMNMHYVRMKAQELFIQPPKFRLLAGLYDQNSLLAEDFARFAISLGVAGIDFWNLSAYPYDTTDVAPADRVVPLDALSDDELKPRMRAIRRAIALLEDAGVEVNAHAGFLTALARRAGLP